METRFRNLLLVLLALSGIAGSDHALSAEQQVDENSALIRPEIERIDFDEAQIEGDDFELILAAGFLSIEDFGVNPVLAAKLNYYVNESAFLQLTLARSKAGETSYEILSGGAPLLTEDERKFSYYAIDIGFNILPGEGFLSESTAYNTAFYVSAGIGNTEFAGSDRFTIDYGAGYRLLLNDDFSLSIDFRDLVFDVDVFGKNKVSNNLQLLLAIGWFF